MISDRDRSRLTKIIAIGYGNTLRSDDGAGQTVAAILNRWHLPQLRSISVHQLTPELAAELAESDLAIFIDVYQIESRSDRAELRVISIRPSEPNQDSGHISNPHSLLYLTNRVYGKAPPAWWILIPAVNFEFGDRLSALTTAGIASAVEQIQQIIQYHLVNDRHNRI